jgi:acetoin utilization deacetylase AcuC-like enzyme
MTTAFITHEDCLLHDMGAHHPEQPARLRAVEDQLIASGLIGVLQHIEAPLAQRKHLERVHQPGYIDRIEESAPKQGIVHLDPDTAMNSHTLTAALRAAGAAVLATDLVFKGEVSSAFCNVRPPGHHAGRRRAMGFCLFNNIAVAAAHALEEHGLERVAIVDFDVHHGNGTEDIVAGDQRILMVSFFQHPFYPLGGCHSDAANLVNLPVPAYTKGMEVRELIESSWMPRLEQFEPEMIFISAGFDAHREDDLGQLGLVEQDYAWITDRVKGVARRHAKGRIVSCLEGGYSLSALGRSVEAHIRVLADV